MATEQEHELYKALDVLEIEATDAYPAPDMNGVLIIVVDCKRHAKKLAEQIAGDWRPRGKFGHYEVFNKKWAETKE